jgi:hypothetical protein
MADSMDVKYEPGKSITYTTNGAPQEIDLQNIIGARKLDGDAWSVLFVETPASGVEADEKEAGLEIKSFQTKDLDAGFLELYTIQLAKDTLPGKSMFPILDTSPPTLRLFVQQLYAGYLFLEVGGRSLSSR